MDGLISGLVALVLIGAGILLGVKRRKDGQTREARQRREILSTLRELPVILAVRRRDGGKSDLDTFVESELRAHGAEPFPWRDEAQQRLWMGTLATLPDPDNYRGTLFLRVAADVQSIGTGKKLRVAWRIVNHDGRVRKTDERLYPWTNRHISAEATAAARDIVFRVASFLAQERARGGCNRHGLLLPVAAPPAAVLA